MRFLPFSFTRGSALADLARAAAEDPRRRGVCAFCGGAVPVLPDVPEQTARCVSCWRWQRVSSSAARPPPLAPDAYAALRRTTRWARSWPEG